MRCPAPLPASILPAFIRRALLVSLLVLPLAACLPAAGPKASAIAAAADASAPPFAVVALDARLADELAMAGDAGFADAFGDDRDRVEGRVSGTAAPELTIGVGDTVVVTIFEAASGGLFSGEPGAIGGSKSVAMPPQPVARSGVISVPYAGQVRASGRTPAEVAAAIEAALRDKAIEPQVLVTLADSSSTFVTVAGDVGQPGRVPLNLAGDRILDIVAAAGGARAPAYDTFVRLTRGGRSATIAMTSLIDDPAQNIYLRPDDQLYVFIDARNYSAFGAVAGNATYPFEADRLSLVEAVGRAGGLLDSRANAGGVFVFRNESPDLYARIRPAEADDNGPRQNGNGVPVVYRLDLKDPAAFFAASRFQMRDDDIVYVANAASVDLQKVFAIVGSSLGTATSTTGAATRLVN